MYVRNKMTVNPFTIAPDATIAEALEMMRQNKIRRLPVVKSGKLAGIVTERELLEVSPSKATTLSIFEMNYLLSKTKVNSVMTKDIKTINPDALLEEAAVRMREFSVGALPVVEGDKLVGIITETNIFDAFIELMGFRDIGSRITVEVGDTPGILADISTIIKNSNVNISHLAVYGSGAGKSYMVIRINSLNIDPIIKEIEARGYSLISVMKNPGD